MTGIEYSPVVRYSTELYEALEKAAKDNMFEGSTVEVFRSLKISQTYYSILFRVLTELGCIEQIRRGNRHSPSLIALRGAPNREQVEYAYRGRLTRPRSIDTMREWVSQLEARIERLEQEVGIDASEAQDEPNP